MFYISNSKPSYMFKQLLLTFVFFTTVISASAQTKDSTHDANTHFKPLKWRSIGPFRGGRSNCGTGVPGDINTYYMGTTGGGLWKTDDLGLNWTNISDGYFKTGSVGAVAVPESDANVVYVGMGEHAIRGVMTHHGDGIYKSTDAGKTWKHMGLEATQHIARIVVHPKDPNTLLVAAQGALYSKSKERGIYKSTDGGTTWKNVLYINENTGCVELSMDMNNPRILYAAMWEHGRKPWQVISGGAGSGLYKSVDGGDSWQKMTNGLPAEMGKMSIAVSRSNPEKVYALIESDSEKEAGGLFVSNNAGSSWSRITNDHRLVQRAWYYIELFVDPNNDQVIYVLSAPALRSKDGGRTWENLGGTHGDYHDLWINPKNSNNMIISNDGGCAVSVNFARTWSPQNNMPTAQFYRINVDNQFPYRIYGGQQDNTSVSIAHRSFGGGAITVSDWEASAGGESAFLAFDPNDPRYVLGGSYQGTIEVLDTKAKGTTNIMPAPIQYLGRDAKDIKYRYNWNAPIIWSKHEPGTYYHGSQLLLKTTDMGKTWSEVSPDLTRNEKEKQGKGGVPYTNEAVGAENYGTLAYVIESPHEKGVIYTGSDDGLVYITKDGCKTWQNITPAGLQECLINAIEVSPHDKATVYIATTRYKFNDHTPGLYKSTDYGKTWTKINTGIPNNAFTRAVREDEDRKDLLFAGTELGLFISFDGGKQWQAFQLNLPVTPITDLRVHKSDLIAATSGRSFWILDDLNVLRQYKKEQTGLYVYQPEDAYITNGFSAMNAPNPSGVSRNAGVNPANGVVLYYQLPELKATDTVSITITDAKGKLTRTFRSVPDNALFYDGAPAPNPTLSKQKGINRFVWDMRYATMPGIPNVYIESSYSGHKAVPGTYTVTLKAGTQQTTAAAVIAANPLYSTTAAEYEAYDAMMSEMENNVTTMHNMVNKLHGKRVQLEDLIKNLNDPKYEALQKEAQALAKDMKAWDEDMIQRKSKAYDDVENFPNKFTANYLFLINQTESDLPRVNQPNIELKKQYDAEWAILKQRAEALETRLTALNKKLSEAGVGAVWK
jgi:photosystem II stability/assembly factor-like uncharacterized protein